MTERGDREAPTRADDGAGLSAEARTCLARWFAGPRHELRSHEPHEILNKVRPAMDELVAKGLVTKEPYNAHGSLVFRPTPEAARIGFAELQRKIAEMELRERRALARGAAAGGGVDGDHA